MTDMTKAIQPKSDQLNADDLIGCTKDITITGVNISSTEQPVSVRFEGDNGKPFKPCKSMCRVMVQCWGPDAKQYTGKSMRLFRDPEVTWAGMKVGGIRISHMSHIDKPMTFALTASKQKRTPYTVHPLDTAPQAQTGADPDVVSGLLSEIQTSETEEALKAAGSKIAEAGLNDAQKAELKAEYAAKLKQFKAAAVPEADEDELPV